MDLNEFLIDKNHIFSVSPQHSTIPSFQFGMQKSIYTRKLRFQQVIRFPRRLFTPQSKFYPFHGLAAQPSVQLLLNRLFHKPQFLQPDGI